MSARVITVAQQKGGVGKSTLAIHLAVAFAKQGLSVMLFDTDMQGTSSHWHAQRKTSDIGLMATSGWRLTRDLAMAREANDIVIIDCPPHAEMDIKVSTRAADMVLLPMQPSPADLWAIRETLNTVKSESNEAMVVLNRVVPRANITNQIKDKLIAMDIPFADTVIGNRVLFAAAMESGMTVLDGFKNPSQQEVMALTYEVAEKIGMQFGKKTQKKMTAREAPKDDNFTTTTSTSKSTGSKTGTKTGSQGKGTLKLVTKASGGDESGSGSTTGTKTTTAKKTGSKTATKTSAKTGSKSGNKTTTAKATPKKTVKTVAKKTGTKTGSKTTAKKKTG